MLLPDAPAAPELPVFLRAMTWVDFRQSGSELYGAALVLHFLPEARMPATNPRVTAVIDRTLAEWLRRRSKREGKSVSVLVRDILSRQYAEEEERYWAGQGDKRLQTFDRSRALSHEEAWE